MHSDWGAHPPRVRAEASRFRGIPSTKVRDRADAITSTRDGRAPQIFSLTKRMKFSKFASIRVIRGLPNCICVYSPGMPERAKAGVH